MVISSKGEYALRVMADLAINHDGRFIPLKEIVQKEELSQKYLQNAFLLSSVQLVGTVFLQTTLRIRLCQA